VSDERYSPTRKPPTARTERAVGELLWEIRADHLLWRAELFDEGAYGFDVRIFRDVEFFASRRWANREAAAPGQASSAGTLRTAGDDGRRSCLPYGLRRLAVSACATSISWCRRVFKRASCFRVSMSSNIAEDWSVARRPPFRLRRSGFGRVSTRLTLQQGYCRALSGESGCETAQSGQPEVIRKSETRTACDLERITRESGN
jgi:hypothetical protein